MRDSASEHAANALQILAGLLQEERIYADDYLLSQVSAARNRIKAAQMMVEECATDRHGIGLVALVDTKTGDSMAVDYRPYLKTLRRIPKGVRLRMATREFAMFNGKTCLCGWAIREALANGVDAEDVPHDFVVTTDVLCRQRFGGKPSDWWDIYSGVTDYYLLPAIELAFTIAVQEACR